MIRLKQNIKNLFLNKNTDLTQGNILKQLIVFAIPFLLSNFLQTLYNLTDTYIISKYIGVEALAAANNGGLIMNIMINIVLGLSVGGTVVIGQIKGSGDSKGQEQVIGTFLTIMTLLGLVFSVIFIVFAKELLIFLDTPKEVLDMAADFLRIYSVAIIFIFGYNSIFSIFRGIGNSFITFFFVLVSVVLNIVLDIVFVVYFKWGIQGAAWATTISIIGCFITSLFYLYKQKEVFTFKLINFKPNMKVVSKILLIGIPSGVQSSIFGLSILIMTRFINGYGVAAVSTLGLGSKIDSIFLLPIIAVASASSAMIAQNYGAKRFDRMKSIVKSTLLINTSLALFFLVITQLFGAQFFALLTDNEEVILLGVMYLRFASFNYLFLNFLQSFNSLAIGVGNTFYALCTTIMNAFVFRVPIGYIFENWLGFGIVGIFIGLGFANVGGGIAGFIYYKIRFHFWEKYPNATLK